MRFHITLERLTGRDLLALEDAQEGKRQYHTIFGIISKFVMDGEDYMDPAKAFEQIADLNGPELLEAVNGFMAKVEELQKSAILPKAGDKP